MPRSCPPEILNRLEKCRLHWQSNQHLAPQYAPRRSFWREAKGAWALHDDGSRNLPLSGRIKQAARPHNSVWNA